MKSGFPQETVRFPSVKDVNTEDSILILKIHSFTVKGPQVLEWKTFRQVIFFSGDENLYTRVSRRIHQ